MKSEKCQSVMPGSESFGLFYQIIIHLQSIGKVCGILATQVASFPDMVSCGIMHFPYLGILSPALFP